MEMSEVEKEHFESGSQGSHGYLTHILSKEWPCDLRNAFQPCPLFISTPDILTLEKPQGHSAGGSHSEGG